MPDERLFKNEEQLTRDDIADALAGAADQLDGGSVELGDGERTIEVPKQATYEVELERQTPADTGDAYFELEFELSWTE